MLDEGHLRVAFVASAVTYDLAMRFDITDELMVLSQLHREHPDDLATQASIEGAAWALGQLTGRPALDIIAEVHRAAGSTVSPLLVRTPEAAAVSPGASTPPQGGPGPMGSMAHPSMDQGLGIYPGVGPITSLPEPLSYADMSKPPAPPRPGSYSDLAQQAVDAEDPAALPMDEETLAEVNAEIEAIRQGKSTAVDDEAPADA